MRLFGKKKKAHTPVEAKESGRSKQRVKIVEILSEGEIEGLVDGLKSVRLDNTPIEAADGSHYFKNVEVEGRVGTQTQEVMAEFQAVEKEISVATEVTKRTALTRTVTDANVNRLRLTLGVQALFEQNNQGDTNPATVELKITVGNQVIPFTIKGKYSSSYSRSIVVENLPKVPFTIKVERITADSTSNRLANKTTWASYTEIIDGQFAYPNTAYMGVKFDSEYFNNIPIRTYEIDGMRVRVPSNYNPETRAYAGLWDGTFKVAYTNNPAWVLMDIVTNKRYGLGDRLGDFSVDKWALYQIAQYCDQMIPDGFGGTEPRFTCNLWLTEQRSAYDVLSDLCSIFRAMPVWNGTELTFIMDRPADPVWTYTNANVVGGFSRQYSAMKARHNAIQVEYKDAENNYENTIEYVSDDEQITKFGLNLRKVTAFGCTSRGQAFRTGKWILETERLETETVSFTVGAEGLMNIPGDIIRVTDNHFAGTNIGGRVLAVNGKQVTLDREINPEHYTANSYFTYINAQAKHQSIRITAVKGNQLTLADTPQGLVLHGIWSLSTQKVVSQLYRCMTITENSEDGTYTIVALQHEPQKEAIVDNGASFEPRQTSVLNTPTVESLNTETAPNGIKLNWATTAGIGTLTYDIKILKEGNLYAYHKGLNSTQFETDELPDGNYTVIIIAKNASGQIVSEKSKTFTIDRPPVPRDVRVLGGLGNITISWAWVDDATMTEIFAAETDDIRQAKRIAKVNAMFFSHEVGAKQVRYYWVRHTRGVNVGAFFQQSGLRGESSVDIDQELKLLNEKLSKNIINEVFDTAAPARKLGMTLYVENLKDVNTYAGQKQVYDETANQMYTWNGTKYVPLETELLASKIKGIIEPSQLAAIPTTKLSGKLTDAQIQALSATKLIGTLNIATVPNIPANKLTGLLALDRLPNMPVSKLSGKVAKNQLDNALIGELTTAQNTANAANTLANTIKTQVEQETANRIKAIASESANLTAKIQAEAKARGTAVTQLQNVDKQQAQQITALTAKADNALSGLEAEKTARANGDKAEAKAREALTARMGTAESNIANVQKSVASANQSISEVSQNLSAKIDGLSVGGRNYASDGKFELGQWEYSTGNANDRISHVEDGIVRVTGKTTTWKQWQLHARMGSLLNNSKRSISLSYLQPNEKYTLSFEARCVSGNPNIWTRIRANTDASRPDNPDVYRKDFMLTEEWQKYRHTAILPAVDGLDYWRLIFGYSQIGIVEYRNIKLELGTIATDWTPAPEDVENSVNTVSAKIDTLQTTLSNADKALSTRIDTVTSSVNNTTAQISTVSKAVADVNGNSPQHTPSKRKPLRAVVRPLRAFRLAQTKSRAP